MASDDLNRYGDSLFQALMGTVSDAITVIDKDLDILFQNEAVRKIYGSMIGHKCYAAYRGQKELCEYCIILEGIEDDTGYQ